MPGWGFKIKETFYRFAATGAIPARLFERRVPATESLPGRTGKLHIEIVSHCWRYSHLLRFHLSSFLLHPPKNTNLTVTIIYCPEDQDTADLLSFYRSKDVPNVTWNFVASEKTDLFRRAIGRNQRAKATQADWIFFSDCDQMFYQDSIDQLSEALQGRRDLLVFPRTVECSLRVHSAEEVLSPQSPSDSKWIVEADPKFFFPKEHLKAIGPTQILHGDVAREVGYCEATPFFQQPATSWHKTYEDRIFRWLLGTHGVVIEVPHVYRIEHHQKGRYQNRIGPEWLRPFLTTAGRKDMLARRSKRSATSPDEASKRAA